LGGVKGDIIGESIFLIPKIKVLSEVSVGNRKLLRTILLGNKVKKFEKDINWGPGSSDSKEEYAQRIDLPDSTLIYKIKKVYIPVRKFVSWGSLLVRIYSEEPGTEFPGEELAIRMVEVDNKMIRKDQLVIDLADLGISLSSKFLYTLQ